MFAGSGSPRLTSAICSYLKIPVAPSQTIQFSEGNLFVRILQNVRGRRTYTAQCTVFPGTVPRLEHSAIDKVITTDSVETQPEPDTQSLGSVDDASVDLVNCQLGLMDIPDLRATLHSVARVAVRGGTFVFVIGHPAFLASCASRIAGNEPPRESWRLQKPNWRISWSSQTNQRVRGAGSRIPLR